jgi:hypothetical protein
MPVPKFKITDWLLGILIKKYITPTMFHRSLLLELGMTQARLLAHLPWSWLLGNRDPL